MAKLDGLRVVRSKIHGYGLIALKAFREGDIICYGDGVTWRDGDDFDDTYALAINGYVEHPDGTVTEDGPDLFYDLADQTRWINHSCDANTWVDSRWDRELHDVVAWWVALRDIAVGEELTYDYAFVAEAAEPCGCGADVCRGVIVDPDPTEMARLTPELLAKLRPAAAAEAAAAGAQAAAG
ncbi:MAG: SET domain-containing protein-lysine N-methyltransferase [Kofleriaceae bacterium]